jgi:hypothetical protein
VSVAQLVAHLRLPLLEIVLLEGATQEAAAVQLNVAKSTLRKRLERARTLLRTRLIGRGLGSALLVAASWPPANASASLPSALIARTIQAARLLAAEMPRGKKTNKSQAIRDLLTANPAMSAKEVLANGTTKTLRPGGWFALVI